MKRRPATKSYYELWDDYPNKSTITVHLTDDPLPKATGVLDASGNMIYRYPPWVPIGFHHKG